MGTHARVLAPNLQSVKRTPGFNPKRGPHFNPGFDGSPGRRRYQHAKMLLTYPLHSLKGTAKLPRVDRPKPRAHFKAFLHIPEPANELSFKSKFDWTVDSGLAAPPGAHGGAHTSLTNDSSWREYSASLTMSYQTPQKQEPPPKKRKEQLQKQKNGFVRKKPGFAIYSVCTEQYGVYGFFTGPNSNNLVLPGRILQHAQL